MDPVQKKSPLTDQDNDQFNKPKPQYFSAKSDKLPKASPTSSSDDSPLVKDDTVAPGNMAAADKPTPTARPYTPPPKAAADFKPPAFTPKPTEPETSEAEPLKPAVPPDKKASKSKLSTAGKAMLVAGPLFLVGSLAFSAYMFLKPPAQQLAAYSVTPTLDVKKYEDLAPTNPTSVAAYADNTQTERLQSSQEYSYDNPYFEWSGAKVKEPGTKIIEYFVHFSSNESYASPRSMSSMSEEEVNEFHQSVIRVANNSFSPKQQGIILEPGKTYYLLIQTVTNGQAPWGFDREINGPSKIYFEYKYRP